LTSENDWKLNNNFRLFVFYFILFLGGDGHAALRLGDKCSNLEDCSLVTHSQCDTGKGGVCACTPEYPVEGGTLCGQGKYQTLI
jgi:hypothetical protein